MSDEEAVIEGPLMPTAEQLQQRDANADKRRHHHHHSHRDDRERDRHSSSSRRDHDSRERKHLHSHKRDGQQEPAQQPKSREDSGLSWMVSASSPPARAPVTLAQVAAPEASAWRVQQQLDDAAAAAAAAVAVRPSVEELLKNRTGLVDIAELKAIAAGTAPNVSTPAASTPVVNWRAVQVLYLVRCFEHTPLNPFFYCFTGATAQEQRRVSGCDSS